MTHDQTPWNESLAQGFLDFQQRLAEASQRAAAATPSSGDPQHWIRTLHTAAAPLLQLAESADEFDGLTRGFAEIQWPWVRRTLLESVAFETLGDGPRETLRQAVAAHDTGLYRCVPWTVFGEVEVVARDVLDRSRHDAALDHVFAPLRQAFELMPHGAVPGFQELLRGERRAGFRDSLGALLYGDLAFRTLAFMAAAAPDPDQRGER